MYRAECTNCISQVANIYDTKKHPIVKEGKLCMIDVETAANRSWKPMIIKSEGFGQKNRRNRHETTLYTRRTPSG